MAYYGIHIPPEKQTAIEEKPPYVYDNREAAFQMLKKHRESRLKAFKTQEEAKSFSRLGIENTTTSQTTNVHDTDQSNGIKANPEKVSTFRGPTSQELVKFRKAIEQGNYDSVHDTIWTNPRYLIGSGDTPSILKESFRYNALHVAALAKNARISKLLLETIGDPKFVQLLHGKDDKRTAEDEKRTAEEVSIILLDLYLNMPEKGRSETPLHLASKYGAVEVVEVLTSYKACQMTTNSDGLLPKDMVCFRVDGASPTTVKAIKSMLQERFYVPVMRTMDNSAPPVIGEPFSPTHPPTKITDLLSPDMEIKALAGPMNKDQADTFRRRWKTPPRLTSPSIIKSPTEPLPLGSSSPLSSYPKTLPRSRHTPNRNRLPNGSQTQCTPTGIESTARKLFNGDEHEYENENNVESGDTAELNFPIDNNRNEFQEPMAPPPVDAIKRKSFMNYRQLVYRPNDSMDDSFIGLSDPQQRQQTSQYSLHQSINDSSIFDSPGYKERNLKLADVDKGLEVIGRGLAKDHNVGWKEHWNFLDEFLDISSADGLTKFEQYLRTKEETKMKPPPHIMLRIPFNERLTQLIESSPLSNICRDLSKFKLSRLANFRSNNDSDIGVIATVAPTSATNTTTNATQSINPSACNAYQCVEKSCQVFARRLLKQIGQQPRNIALINDALTCELNRLKSLVCSYKEDPRFFAVDFRSAHSRFAHLIVWFLRDDRTVIDMESIVNDFQISLQQILESKLKNGAFAENGLTTGTITATPISPTVAASTTSSASSFNGRSQLLCLIKFLLERLTGKDILIAPETLTTEQDCTDVWSSERKCECQWSVEQGIKHMRALKRKQENHKLNQIMNGQTDINCYRENRGLDDDDDECYLSLSESDDDDESDVFYTPPESPTQMFYNTIEEYTNYIYGDIPTKMDNDVMTALHSVQVDPDLHPFVFKWHTALQNHSLEERNNFPPPLISKRHSTTPIIKPKQLFQSPVRSVPRPPIIQLKPSILSANFND